jgi:diguanylate cyclase (GGDEF)-like protein/PAS domain S-box-containing protein
MPYHRLLALVRRGAGTLKFKIVALAVLTGIAASIASVQVALGTSAREIQASLLEREAADAERTAALLGDKLEMLQSSLAAVKTGAPAALWESPAKMTQYLVDKPSLVTMFDSVAAADAAGQPLALLRRGRVEGVLPNLVDNEYFKRAIVHDQPVVSRPFIGPISRVPIVALTHPAIEEAGRPLGVLIGTVPLRSTGLFSLTARHGGNGMREIVVDRHGAILSHPDPDRILAPAADEAGLRSTVTAWLDSGAPIDMRASVAHADGNFVALAGIPGSDWVLVRATEEAVALRAVDAARRSAWGYAALAGLFASLLAGGLGWRVTQPITRLRRCAERQAAQPDAVVHFPPIGGEVGRLSAAFSDVLDRMRRREKEVKGLLGQLQLVLVHAKVGIALTRGTRIELVSAELETVVGLPASKLVGATPRVMCLDETAYEALREESAAAMVRTGEFEREVEMVRGDGRRFWCHVRARSVARGDPAAGAIWLLEDVTDRRSRHDELAWAAQHDPLTGLANRAAFDRALQAADGHDYVALFIDLDRFKAVNDTCGHAAGDEMLREVATLLSEGVRQHDVVARLGGDEFAVLLRDCPMERARQLAEQMRRRVAAHELHWEGHRLTVGASIGVVPSRTGLSPAAVMAAADAACYAAKRGGRDRVEVAVGLGSVAA